MVPIWIHTYIQKKSHIQNDKDLETRHVVVARKVP